MAKKTVFALVVVLLAVLAAAYLPVLQGTAKFIWDDNFHVHDNAAMTSPGGLGAIWSWGPKRLFDANTEPATPQYYPLTFTTIWLQTQLHGNQDPLPFHVGNLVLHAGSALLLWGILRKLGMGPFVAFAVALVFAVHPVQVESVAWASERKNTLALFFMLAAGLAYVSWARLGEETEPAGRRSWALYALALGLFACALLSKTVTSMLPVALLVLTWYKRGKLVRRDVLATVPMFLMALPMGLLTSFLERNVIGAVGPDFEMTFARSVLIAGRAIAFYMQKLVAPMPLSFIYERWEVSPAHLVQWLFPLAVVAVMGVLFALRGKLGRGPAAGVALFGVLLFPALGFFKFFPMRFSFVADHFQYFASAAMISALVAGVAAAIRRIAAGNRRTEGWTGFLVLVPVVAVLAFLAHGHARLFQDSETLWRDSLAKDPRCWMAAENLAGPLILSGEPAKVSEAVGLLKRVLEIRPTHLTAYNALGNAYLSQNNLEAARGTLAEALTLAELKVKRYPHVPEAVRDLAMIRNTLASVYAVQGDAGKAKGLLEALLKDYPKYVQAWRNLGNTERMLGRMDASTDAYRKALELAPRDAVTHAQIGINLITKGNYTEAVRTLEYAISLKPDFADAWNNLGRAHRFLDQNEKAIEAYLKAIHFDRKRPIYFYNLGEAYYAAKNEQEAASAFGAAYFLDKNFAAAAAALAEIRSMAVDARVRSPLEAIDLAQRAVELTQEQNVIYLELLAQAYSEAKQYENAVKTMERAIVVAGQQNASYEQLRSMEQRYRKYNLLRSTRIPNP